MNKDLLIEKMLESENLTGDLEDNDARWLLDWGINRVDMLLEGINDEETAGDKMNDLMAVMRQLNRLAGSPSTYDPADLAAELLRLHNLFLQVFPANPAAAIPSDLPALEDVAKQINQDSSRQALEYLAQWPNWLPVV